MKITKGKLMVSLLALIMGISILSVTALAEETTTEVNDLASLTSALSNGGGIKLTDNITLEDETTLSVTQNTVLDLNGFSITRTGGTINGFIIEIKGASLTINDSEEGGGKIVSSNPSYGYGIQLYSDSTLIMNGGSIETTRESIDIYTITSNVKIEINDGAVTSSADNVLGIRGDSNIEVTINGGTLTSGKDAQVAVYASTYSANPIQFTMTGGSITSSGGGLQIYKGTEVTLGGDAKIELSGNSGIQVQENSVLNVTGDADISTSTNGASITAGEQAKVNIDGGTVTNKKSSTGTISVEDSAEVNISGGVVKNENTSAATIRVANDATVNVSGGELYSDSNNKGIFNKYGDDNNSTITVTNGTFDKPIDSSYLPSGMVTEIDPETGKTTVKVDENTAIAMVGGAAYTTLEEAIAKAADGATVTLLDNVELASTIKIEKSITIEGAGYTIKGPATGVALNFVYQDGTKVSLNEVNIDGNNGGGALQWTIAEDYRINDNPTTMPSLSITDCNFTNTQAPNTGAGIGMWGVNKEPNKWFDAAASEVLIDGCTFDGLSVGIYYNEEAPLLNLRSTVTNNTFKNISWTGIAGIPANAEIAYNDFQSTCGQAIQYLFNAKQTETNTSIHDNIIDSVKGIQFMPYHLNEENENGDGETVEVTAAMVPSIEKNIRNTDTNLVTIVAYRSGTDETITFAEPIDLTENYTQGKKPTVEVTVQPASGGNTTPAVEDVTPEINDDIYYLDDNLHYTNINPPHSSTSTYSVTVEKADNGSITVSPKNAHKGSIVTITIEPDKGYVLSKLTVKDEDGDKIDLTKKNDTKYTFKMPASDVEIKAVFVEEATASMLPFYDVTTADWFYDAVQFVYEEDMMQGTSANAFSPYAATTRGMLVTILYRLEGEPAVTGNPFSDVAANTWYTDAISWSAANEIVVGHGNGLFGPNDNLTREQLATILYRYAAFKGYDVTVTGNLAAFIDAGAASDWAQTALAWAVENGVMNGNGNGVLDPTGTTTRAHVAQMLMNFCDAFTK